MSKYLTVSPEVYAMIERHVTPGFTLSHAESKALPDGRVQFPVEDDTWDRLDSLRRRRGQRGCETDDQLLYRVLGGRSN